MTPRMSTVGAPVAVPGADGRRARLEHHIVGQRRRVEVDKFALRPAGVDDVAVAHRFPDCRRYCATPLTYQLNSDLRAQHADVVIGFNAAIAIVD